jgi:hypothetical protein
LPDIAFLKNNLIKKRRKQLIAVRRKMFIEKNNYLARKSSFLRYVMVWFLIPNPHGALQSTVCFDPFLSGCFDRLCHCGDRRVI